MNSIPALFSSIETHAPKFQAFLERLTAQESFTFEPETVTRAADLTAAFAETLGFSVERKRLSLIHIYSGAATTHWPLP